MGEKLLPTNSVAEIMRMCEGATTTELIIILKQVDEEKDRYTPQELSDCLLFISAQRRKNEVEPKWNALIEKLGL